MSDILSITARSKLMAKVCSRNTKPELLVRRMLFALGYRYRLHVSTLPGCPDLVFPARRKVIFVHGCFWHRHNCRRGQSTPSTRPEFWEKKFLANRSRDRRSRRELHRRGWQSLVLWECGLSNTARVLRICVSFLNG